MIERFTVVPAAYLYLLRRAAAPGEDVDPGCGPGAASGRTEVLLQLRRATGYRDGYWAAGAAGHVERGETAYDAVRREAFEELGIEGLKPTFATTMHRTAHDLPIDERIDFFFTARSWQGEPRIVEPDKCADLRWWPIDALPAATVPHERTVLGWLHEDTLAPYTTNGFRPAAADERTQP